MADPAIGGTTAAPAVNTVAATTPVAAAAPAATTPSQERVISIALQTDLYFNSGIRDFAVNFIQNMTSLSEKWSYRFQSIVDELCNNAIEHGSADGDQISVHFAFTDTYVKVWVEDNGTGKDATSAANLTKRLEELKVQNADPLNVALRGRGIVKIIQSWTDEFTYEDRSGGGLRVQVVKYLETARKEDEEMNAVDGVTFGS